MLGCSKLINYFEFEILTYVIMLNMLKETFIVCNSHIHGYQTLKLISLTLTSLQVHLSSLS